MRRLASPLEAAISDGQLVIVEGSLPDALPALTDIRIDQIVRSAACLQPYRNGSDEPFTTNVDGVKSLARWAERHDIGCLHLVSTAYVCGRDVIRAEEKVLTEQPRFETDYELSKFQAESFLLDWASSTGAVLTILRPSLVVGDSRTGFTTQYGGFYQDQWSSFIAG